MSYTTSILLRWSMSTESDLAGYKVYRGDTSRVYGPPVLTLGLITCSSGAPQALVGGIGNDAPSYLALTAYDSFGNESTFSAEVTAQKPVPLLTLLRQVV